MCKAEVFTPVLGDVELLRDYAALYNAVDSFDNPGHIELTYEYFQSSFLFSNVNLLEDFLLVRNDVGELIAAGTIIPECNSSSTSRLSIEVHPQHRQQGIGSEILNRLIQIGLKRGSSEFVCRFPSFRSYAATFLEKHGFSYDYTSLNMQADLKTPGPVFPLPLGLTVRALNIKKELAIWAQLQNAIFREFSDYEAVNTEILTSIVKHSAFDRSLLVIGTLFSKPIGFCLGFSMESAAREKILRIEGMGVLPEFRRRGYGCILVSEILIRAYIKEHVSSELIVRSSDKSAITLYEKCGFKESYKHMSYKRRVAQSEKGRGEIG